MHRGKAKYKLGVASGGAVAAQPLSFSIPLKDASKPMAFPANFRKHIALEFAMRYLCEVSVFVDAVSSAIGSAIAGKTMESDRRGNAARGTTAISALPLTAATTTSRDGSGRHRQSGDRNTETSRGRVGNINSSAEYHRREQGHRRGGRANTRGFGYGVSKNNPADSRRHRGEKGGAVAESRGGGGSDDSGEFEEHEPCDVVALAEARRKMLDPPKVDMSAIATVQAAFARNFPFNKHGEKFSDISVRSSLKNLITSEGPGRLIGLLSHYLYWIMVLPFALVHKDSDDCVLQKTDCRFSKQARMKAGDSTSGSRALVMGSKAKQTSATTTARTPEHEHYSDSGGSDQNKENAGRRGQGQHQHPPLHRRGVMDTMTRSSTFSAPNQEAVERFLPPKLTEEEAENLFVAVIEAWSSLRASLGASRRARLVQLPIAVAAVRHGVQTVLCSCYPFLDTKGGRDGKRLLASLHEEVTARFIPRFYYEGPFTPVAEEEKEDAINMTKFAASTLAGGGGGGVPAPAPCKERTRCLDISSPSPPLNSPSFEKKKLFLETSENSLAARRRARAWAGSASDSASSGPASAASAAAAFDTRPSTTAGIDLGSSDEAPRVVRGSTATQSARDRPGGTRRTGEALFATSTTFGYVFPNPRSPEARKMLASRARASSSRDASRTTSPTVGMGRGSGFTRLSRSTDRRPVTHTSAGRSSRAASTSGARGQPLWMATGEGGNSRRIFSSSHTARQHESLFHHTARITTSNSSNNDDNDDSHTCRNVKSIRPVGEEPKTTVAIGGARRQQHPQKRQQQQLTHRFRDGTDRGAVFFREATATGSTRPDSTTRVHDQSPWAGKDIRPSTTAAAHVTVEYNDRVNATGRGQHRASNTIRARGSAGSRVDDCGQARSNHDRSSGEGLSGSGGGMDVHISVGVRDVGVGPAAKARLYRGYCEQRGEDYEREYRRHGGKEALDRMALLNDTFR